MQEEAEHELCDFTNDALLGTLLATPMNGPKVKESCLSKIWLFAGIPVNSAVLVLHEGARQ